MGAKANKRKKKETLSDLYLAGFASDSSFAESYRTLRANLHFSLIENGFNSLLVTSAGEGEGKSTTVANLSYTLAQAGKSVLMIDADLRKPKLSTLVAKDASTGLTGILTDALGTAVSSGSLSDFSVSDLIRLLGFQKNTGVLHLEEGSERIHIYFLNGDLLDVQWLTRPEDKKLAVLLVKNGLINKEQAQQALQRKQNTGQKLGFILINMGLVKEEDLAGFITLHMLEGLRTALLFKEGLFSFKRLTHGRFEKRSYDPVNLPQVYQQVVLGEEELVFLSRKVDEAIVATESENLFLLPSGSRPPKPAELLGSLRMSFLLTYLARRFDILLVDSPPVLLASDAALLAPHTDGVLLIVKAGQMNREAVKKAADQLKTAKANLVGVALNQMDVKREGYYRYYAKYYGEYK